MLRSIRGLLRVQIVIAVLVVALTSLQVLAQDGLPDVPREQTLITQGWDFYNQIPSADNFNPYLGALLHARNNLHYTVYESLFYYDYFTGKVIPWQAESYKYNDDYTAVTLKLRPNVVWSDGQPFTADDVVFTIDMLKANAPELQLASAMNTWVKSVSATDATTVDIQLTQPGPRWVVDTFATGQTGRFIVVPKHIWDGKDAKTFSNLDIEQGWPVGTGPYKLVYSGADSVVFDRRDSWWATDAGLTDHLPAPQRIVYVPATVEAMPQLYISNSIDMGRSLSAGDWDAASAQNPNLITWNKQGPVWGAPDGCVYRLTFNNQHPPFDNADIRRAVDAAIDRDQLVQLAYEGTTSPAVVPLSSFSGVQAYASQLQDLIDASGVGKHDLDKVAEIMQAQGYKRSDAGQWVDANGDTLKLNIDMEASNPAGPILAQQLQDAGFDVNTQALQGAAFTDAATAGTFDLHLWVHCGSTYDPYLTLEHYHSRYAAPEGQAVGNLRAYTRYANPDMDALIDKMQSMVPSPDDKTYMNLVRQAIQIYLRDLPDITLAEERQIIPFNTTYWTGWPTSDNPYSHPFIPWDGFNMVIERLQPAQQ